MSRRGVKTFLLAVFALCLPVGFIAVRRHFASDIADDCFAELRGTEHLRSIEDSGMTLNRYYELKIPPGKLWRSFEMQARTCGVWKFRKLFWSDEVQWGEMRALRNEGENFEFAVEVERVALSSATRRVKGSQEAADGTLTTVLVQQYRYGSEPRWWEEALRMIGIKI